MNLVKKHVVIVLLMSMVVVFGLSGCSKSRTSKDENETTSITSSTNRETTSNIHTLANKNGESEEGENTSEAEETNPEENIESEVKPENSSESEEVSVENHGVSGNTKASTSAINAFAKLLSGNTSFIGGSVNPNVNAALREDLVTNGQHPYAIVITCSDSRVPAELIFNAGLGEIFVIRTAGNVVSDFEIGSVEYGAEHLESPLVFVLGHTNCGAVTAATEGGEAGGSIQAIVNEIAPSVAKARENGASEDNLLSKSIELNVLNSINKIRQSHIMNELEEEGKVAIIGGVYDIQHGTIKIIE